MSDERVLIEELMHNATVSGNQVLERRLADVTVWFYRNRGGIDKDNLAARNRFLEKALECQLEINALLLQRIRQTTGSKNLWLPSGMMMDQKPFS